MPRILKKIGIVLGSVIGVFSVITAIVSFVLTDSTLTKLTREYAAEYVDGKVELARVSVSLWRRFPSVTVTIDSVALIAPSTDTLLSAGELSASVDLHYLFFSRLFVRHFSCSDLVVNGAIDEMGVPNWNVLKLPPSDTTATDFTVDLRRMRFEGKNRLTFSDAKEGIEMTVDFDSLRFKGNLSTDIKKIKIDQFDFKNIVTHLSLAKEGLVVQNSIGAISLDVPQKRMCRIKINSRSDVTEKGNVLCRDFPLNVAGIIDFRKTQQGEIGFENLVIDLAGIRPTINGSVVVDDRRISSDLVCRIDSLSVANLIAMTPEYLAPEIKTLSSNVSFEVVARAEGVYDASSGVFPDMSLDLSSDHGFIRSSDTKIKLDDLRCNIGVKYDNKNRLWCDIRELVLKGAGIFVDVKGSVKNVLVNPAFSGSVVADVDLKTLSTLVIQKENIVLSGDLAFSCQGALSANQLNLQKIGQSVFDSRLTLTNVRFRDLNSRVSLYFDGNVDVKVVAKDSVLLSEKKVVSVSSRIDTLSFNNRDSVLLTISKLDFGMRSAPSLLGWDTTRVNPFVGDVHFGFVKLEGVDSMMLYSAGANCRYRVKAFESNPKLPEVDLFLDSKLIYSRDLENRYVGVNSSFGVNVLINDTIPTDNKRMVARLDSLQRVYPEISRDSLVAYSRKMRGGETGNDDFKSEDIDFSIDQKLSDFIRRLTLKGTLSSDTIRVITPYMPLVNRLLAVDVTFTQDELKLRNAAVQVGDTKVNLKCTVSNIARVIAGRGRLKLRADVLANELNGDELLRATIAGMLYGESSQSFKDSLSISDNELMQQMLAQNNENVEKNKVLVVIPSNVDADIRLNLFNGTYQKLKIDSMDAQIVIKNRCAQIKEMCAATNIGHFDVSAIYSTKSKTDLVTGFDLDITRMNISQLVQLLPAIDSIFPMMRSFEGIVDCRLAATAAIDTAMNIVLPTLNAACHIRGDSVVLLDGETFGEIAKTLRFRNKKRNVIDNISLELLVKDNVMEVFPFVMEMDRYKTAISGYHNLDLTYYYHISVLHSPLPFRLGIDVKGDEEDFKFRITKAKYKNGNIPSYTAMIDTTRMNLRDKIANVFQRQKEVSLHDFAINTTQSDRSVRVESEPLTDADSVALRAGGFLEEKPEPLPVSDSLMLEQKEIPGNL